MIFISFDKHCRRGFKPRLQGAASESDDKGQRENLSVPYFFKVHPKVCIDSRTESSRLALFRGPQS